MHGPRDVDEIIAAVLEDLPSWSDEPALRLAYLKDGERVEPTARKAVRDLKPPPPVMRELLDEVAQRAADGDIRSARQAAAYGTDVAKDNSGNTKPTALHFTAGQQTFLGAVADIHDGVSEDDVREALVGPWRRDSKLKSLGWDPMGAFSARMYALRASNPASESRPCVPGAEWLAFIGMSFFATLPYGTRAQTSCVRGGWKDAQLIWPLWSAPATARTIESLLRTTELEQMSARARSARGIAAVLSARILRSDQGGYGAFSPTRVC